MGPGGCRFFVMVMLRPWHLVRTDYSDDSKTGEVIRVRTIFRSPPGHGRIFAPNSEMSHRWGVSFGHSWKRVHDTVRACFDCTQRAGARAGLHHKFRPLRMVRQLKKLLQPSNTPKRGNCSQRQKMSV